MKKLLSILMVVFLVGIFAVYGMGQSGLDASDIPRLINELAKKGLTTTPMVLTKPNEYVVGLYKLNQLTEEEISKVKELKLITIWVDDHFSNNASDEKRAYLLIDYRAPVAKIKDYLKDNAAFAYSEHLKEVKAYKKCKEIGNFLSSRGMNGVVKGTFINWRECLIGIKKLSFISEYEIRKARLGKVEIRVGERFDAWRLGDAVVVIDYKASLKEIKKFLCID